MNTNYLAKRILCYGDSNTWGWVPLSLGAERYSIEKRWTGVLQNLLGKDYEVIEEGLGGRTTMFNDPRPEFPERNGLKIFPIILESHLPLSLVILMLGTTDTKEMMNLSAQEITKGMRHLIRAVRGYRVLEGAESPKILIIVPPIVREKAEFASNLFRGGSEKGGALVKAYKDLAESEKVFYIDSNKEINVDKIEGIHIDAANHKKLAGLIYQKIVKIV